MDCSLNCICKIIVFLRIVPKEKKLFSTQTQQNATKLIALKVLSEVFEAIYSNRRQSKGLSSMRDITQFKASRRMTLNMTAFNIGDPR